MCTKRRCKNIRFVQSRVYLQQDFRIQGLMNHASSTMVETHFPIR